MSRWSDINKIKKQIRASKVYADWVMRNRGFACVGCDSTESLEVHHITDLYHILLGLWKIYGDWDAVFQHALSLHVTDSCDNATLCHDCHDKLHPAKHTTKVIEPQQIALWAALPRNLGVGFSQGTKRSQANSVGLVSFQCLIGFGWLIMNEGAEDRVLEFHRRKFARLLGKTPGTSFNKSLNKSLHSLAYLGILDFHIQFENSVEVHLSREYVGLMDDQPWFFPLEDANTSRMLTLTLKWFLSFQTKRKGYGICRDKLAGHLGLVAHSNAWMDKAVTSAVESIPWVTMNIHDDVYRFTMKGRGATPIHSLRAILRDSI